MFRYGLRRHTHNVVGVEDSIVFVAIKFCVEISLGNRGSFISQQLSDSSLIFSYPWHFLSLSLIHRPSCDWQRTHACLRSTLHRCSWQSVSCRQNRTSGPFSAAWMLD